MVLCINLIKIYVATFNVAKDGTYSSNLRDAFPREMATDIPNCGSWNFKFYCRF
jgi:hypothetical protein